MHMRKHTATRTYECIHVYVHISGYGSVRDVLLMIDDQMTNTSTEAGARRDYVINFDNFDEFMTSREAMSVLRHFIDVMTTNENFLSDTEALTEQEMQLMQGIDAADDAVVRRVKALVLNALASLRQEAQRGVIRYSQMLDTMNSQNEVVNNACVRVQRLALQTARSQIDDVKARGVEYLEGVQSSAGRVQGRINKALGRLGANQVNEGAGQPWYQVFG